MSEITMTPVIAPPATKGGRGFGTGEVRARYLKVAENLRQHKDEWFDLGDWKDTKLDYLMKVLKPTGCEVTTRSVGNKAFRVYARYTGQIRVKSRKRTR